MRRLWQRKAIGLSLLRMKQQASDLQPQIVAYYKSDDENIVIVQASNGKYFNHYGYDEDSNNFASAAGGFDTFEEAEQTLYALSPTAIDITGGKANSALYRRTDFRCLCRPVHHTG